MNEVEATVRQVLDALTGVAGAAARWTTRLLLGATIVCSAVLLLGIAALDGGIETVWIVLGLVATVVAIGCATIARWQIGMVRRHLPDIGVELENLLAADDPGARTVVEAVVIDDGDPERGPSDRPSFVGVQQFTHHWDSLSGSISGVSQIGTAIASITRLPALVATAIAISVGLALLSPILLLAWAL